MRRRPTAAMPIGGAASSRSRRSAWLLMSVVGLGVTGTTLAAVALHRADEERLTRALTQQTSMVSQVVAAEVSRYRSALIDLAAALGAQGQIEESEFRATTASRRPPP